MQLEENNPLHRKTIVPWYDTEPWCLVVVVFTFAVALFALIGFQVAEKTPRYQEFAWVPALLAIMASWVIVSITVRLIRRFFLRRRRNRL